MSVYGSVDVSTLTASFKIRDLWLPAFLYGMHLSCSVPSLSTQSLSCGWLFILSYSSKCQIQCCSTKSTRAKMSRGEVDELIYFQHLFSWVQVNLAKPKTYSFLSLCRMAGSKQWCSIDALWARWICSVNSLQLFQLCLSAAIQVKPFQSCNWKQTLPKQELQYIVRLRAWLQYIINADISFKCHCSLADHSLPGFLVNGLAKVLNHIVSGNYSMIWNLDKSFFSQRGQKDLKVLRKWKYAIPWYRNEGTANGEDVWNDRKLLNSY